MHVDFEWRLLADGREGPMTIIVGIVAKQGLVIASDSQASSFRGVQVKRSDYTKIYDFAVNERFNVLLTGAGQVAFVTKATEKIAEACQVQHPNTLGELSELAEDKMNELTKRYVVDKAKQLGVMRNRDLDESVSGPTKLQIEPPSFVLVMGIAGEEQGIFVVSPEGIAEKAFKYTSLGSGSPFAEYLLARLCPEEPSLNEAIDIAAYVVEEVKKIDPHCGGQTQVVCASKDGVSRKSSYEVRQKVDELAARDDALSRLWRAMVVGDKTEDDVRDFLEKDT